MTLGRPASWNAGSSGGLSEDVQTAEALGISLRTVKRDWAKARSWLYADLDPTQDS